MCVVERVTYQMFVSETYFCKMCSEFLLSVIYENFFPLFLGFSVPIFTTQERVQNSMAYWAI